MSIAAFEKHLNDNVPSFQCYAAGDRARKTAFVARVNHRIQKPAVKDALRILERLLGDAAMQIRQLYELHNGMLLYCDPNSDAAGIEMFKISRWKEQTRNMQRSLRAMGFDQSELPEWSRTGIVFGEIPHSANYFVIGTQKDTAGRIFYADHDDFNPDPIAKDFSALLNSILRDPASFLYDRGCYTRYSDGVSETQWIPKKYVPRRG